MGIPRRRRARVLTFANQKGGSGKSLGANLFSKILAERGDSVLVVDCDDQAGNLSSDLEADKTLPGLAELVRDAMAGTAETGTGFVQAVSPDGGIGLLAGSTNLAALNVELSSPGAIGREGLLRRALSRYYDSYDWIVIDTAGDFSVLSLAALVASDDVLVPCRATASSVQGASTIVRLCEQVRDSYNPGLKVAGVFLNDFNAQALVHRDLADMVSRMCEATSTRLMSTRLRHSTKADALVSYSAGIGELAKGTVRRGLVMDAWCLVEEYLSTVGGGEE